MKNGKMKLLCKLKSVLCISLSVMLVMSMMLTGCGNDSEKIEVIGKKSDEERKPQIGMCFDSFVIERWQRDRDVFVSMAKELGAEVNVQNANGDIEEQKNQIDYFIKKGMDVIVIVCIDSDSLADSVKKAKDAGIKVIAYDRLINDSDIDLYISFDNQQVGKLMADTLVDNGIAEKNVIMVGGSVKDNNVSLVEGPFVDIMKDNNVTILDQTHCDGWKAELAAEYVSENMDLVEQASAIMCGNDDLAGQVINTLSERRLAGSILVTGQDADLSACQRIVEGTQVMTVYKPVEKLAQQAAEYAVALAEGKTFAEGETSYIESGSHTVPYVGLDPICVTKDNIDDVIINSGFHSRDEVYLNVNK